MTNKQRLFVSSYLSNGLCAARAAVDAGYSKHTAYSQGERLLRNVEIRAAIDERLKEIESEKIASAKETLEFLTAVMRGEIIESIAAQVGTGKGYFHAELLEKPPSIKDRLTAAATLAKLLKVGENEESATDDLIIIELPPKNPKI